MNFTVDGVFKMGVLDTIHLPQTLRACIPLSLAAEVHLFTSKNKLSYFIISYILYILFYYFSFFCRFARDERTFEQEVVQIHKGGH